MQRILFLLFCSVFFLASCQVRDFSASDSVTYTGSQYPDIVVATSKSTTDKYNTTLHYPVFSGSEKNIFETFAQKQRENALSTSGSGAAPLRDYKLDFSIEGHNDNIASLLFHETKTYSGGTTEQSITTRTYNHKTQRVLSLVDILAPGASLQRLAETTAMKLRSQSGGNYDTEILTRYFAPSAENYSEFVLANNGVVWYFPDYPVASGSSIQTLYIPYTDMGGILAPSVLSMMGANTGSVKSLSLPPKSPFKIVSPVLPEKLHGRKIIALTFDDGPHSVQTPRLLDILAKENVRATFFLIGKNAAISPEIVQKIHSGGHVIGDHTWNHVVMPRVGGFAGRVEIDTTKQQIEKTISGSIFLVRPPYGAIDDEIRLAIPYPLINWDIDPYDWKVRNTPVIVKRVLAAAHPGGIILMHDIYGTTVDAVPEIIGKLKEQGYQFVTIPELLGINEANFSQFAGGVYNGIK